MEIIIRNTANQPIYEQITSPGDRAPAMIWALSWEVICS